MLGQLSNVMEAVSKVNKAQILKSQAFNQSRSYEGSDSMCDIPLREPLDPEYRLNRKLARQIYNKERLEQVKQNKIEQQEREQQLIDAKNKKQKKIDKKKEDNRKAELKNTRFKLDQIADKRENI